MFAITLVAILLATPSTTIADATGDPIWIYDSDLYVKHVEVADLNGDGVLDVIGGEYSSNYYGEPSRVIAIDGLTGDTLWTYLVQDGIRSMTIGDINNDNVADVIAGASYNSSGTPDGDVHAIDGTDGSQIWAFSIDKTISCVAIGDFNGDLYMDVAAGIFGDYVYAINGETGTQLWAEYMDGLWFNGVATGDVNGDLIDDVAFAQEYLTGFTNYYGVLDGTDGDPIWADTVDFASLSTEVVDIDNDGTLEAIFGHYFDDDHAEVRVYTASNGDLEWSYALGTATTNSDIVLGVHDLDGDLDLDLVVGFYIGSYFLTAFDGENNTPYWVSQELDGYPRDLGFGDIDNSGEVNVLAATYDRVQVLFGESGKKYYYYAVGGTISAVTAADVDDDDTLEVIAAGGADHVGTPPDPGKSIWALKTIVSPVLWEHDFGQYGNALVVADLGGRDGYEDVVTASSLDDLARAINGQNGGELWSWTGTENLYAITAGDFDNDGLNDVAVAGNDDQVTALNGADGSVMWTYPTGNQVYRKCLKSADLNDDNAVDVIAGSDAGYIFAINGPDGEEIWTYALGGQATDVKLKQMDGVGPVDVVASVGSTNAPAQIVVLKGDDGTLLWSYTATGSVEHLEPLDCNNDGVIDVAGTISGNKVFVVDGSTHLSLWDVPIASAGNTQSIDGGDLNGDKFDDVVVPGNSTDRVVWALSGEDGSTLWSYPVGGEVNCVMVYDVDNDGQREVVAGSDDQVIYVIDGSSGDLEWSFNTADDVMDIAIGDISGDGLPNIACLTFGSDGIAYAFESLASGPLNSPPLTPAVPTGPTVVAAGLEAQYSAVTTDPEDDQIYYGWDFDGGGPLWDGPYASGTPGSYGFTWATPGNYDVRVMARDELNELSGWSDALAVLVFICGDANNDGIVNVTDAVYIIQYIFNGGPAPDPLESADANCDGISNVSDAVYIIEYIFAGGPAPCENCP
jgi:outer membrane protein assembly factor BamB